MTKSSRLIGWQDHEQTPANGYGAARVARFAQCRDRTDQLLANLKSFVPGLRKIQMLPGCGHWTQQERPNEVSAAIVEFIQALPSRS